MSGRPIAYRELLALAQLATGFDIPVPGVPGEVVQVRPDIEGTRWKVVRRHLFGHAYLTEKGWRTPEDIADGEAFSWPLPQAVQRATTAAAEQGVEHARWLAERAARAAVAVSA